MRIIAGGDAIRDILTVKSWQFRINPRPDHMKFLLTSTPGGCENQAMGIGSPILFYAQEQAQQSILGEGRWPPSNQA
ncbi:MAG TPA: hypothetical protein VJ001_10585 [Rhodocyclaceae bacterium]|nr:hypothetical protein [Rhodocyclaceae bacterium]